MGLCRACKIFLLLLFYFFKAAAGFDTGAVFSFSAFRQFSESVTDCFGMAFNLRPNGG